MQSVAQPSDAPASNAPATVRSLPSRLGAVLLIGALVVALDQATKALIRAWLAPAESWPRGWELIRISNVENTGAAFGILQGAGGFLVVTSVVAVVAVLAFLFWAPPHSRTYRAALALILGGAVGNLIDRVTRGSVTDFIDPTHYPAFNVADSSIVIGVGLLVLLSFLDDGSGPPDRAEDGAPAP